MGLGMFRNEGFWNSEWANRRRYTFEMMDFEIVNGPIDVDTFSEMMDFEIVNGPVDVDIFSEMMGF